MSSLPPTGSKALKAITPSSVYYLTGPTTSSDSFTGTDYSRPLGKPLSNYTVNPVDPNIIRTVEAGLPDTINSVPVIFKNFPLILQNDDDITVGDVSTQIDVSFISEYAGYLNSFGYYFYYLDSNNNPVRLTNTEANANSSNGYYYPTIVFPNSSLSNSGGALTAGGTRRLRGNMPDGSFRNIKVGFFLISNGWSTSGNGQLTTGTGFVMHTTDKFNSTYDSNYVNDSAHALTRDIKNHPDGTIDGTAANYRRGVQSALLYYVTENSWVLSFEDISRPSGDSDFNDLVLLVKKTPTPDSAEIEKYTTVTPPPDITTKGLVDSDGLFLWLDADKMCKNGTNLYFTRTTTFRTTDIHYQQNGSSATISPKDYVLDIIQHLHWNYSHQIIGQTSNTITQSFMFTPTDIATNTVKNKVKLYLLSRVYNVDNKTLVTPYETNYQMLLDYQSVFVDLWYSTRGHSTYIDHEDFSFKCGSDDNTALDTPNTNFQKVTIVLLAWGDPYIQKIDGTVHKLPDVQGRYSLLKNEQISIEADTTTSPDTEQLDAYRGTTFFRNFYVDLKNKGKFEIDLNTMNFKSEGSVKYSIKFDQKIMSTITDTVLLDALQNDPKQSAVTVVIENVKMSFIRLPSSIFVQNIVMFDMDSIKTYATDDSTGLIVGR